MKKIPTSVLYLLMLAGLLLMVASIVGLAGYPR
jgi:hypothetical protein